MKAQKFRFKKADIGVFNTMESDLALNNFEKGCRILGLTRGAFSLIDLIYSTLKKTGPAHIVTATWSAGIKDVNNIKWMIDSKLILTYKIITDHSFATRKSQYTASIIDIFGEENIRTSEIHAKFVLVHNDEYKVCIRTSMNLNANKTCENFEIDEDAEIFKFYMDFVEHLVGDMPKGFVKESVIANTSLDKYFNTTKTDTKWWTNI